MEEFLRPIAETIADEVDKAGVGEPSFPSRRLGPSKLGHVCPAYPWHLWRWSAKVTMKAARRRTAKTGTPIEQIVILELRAAGWQIRDRDQYGNQYQASSHNGHVVSKIEGFATHPKHFPGEEILLEIKGLNKRRYNLVKSDKFLRETEPQMYAQAVKYMAQFALRWTLFAFFCRDDGEMVFKLIPADPEHALFLDNLATSIITSKTPLSKVSNQATNHICRQCEMLEPCQFKAAPPRTCRSCFDCAPSVDVPGRMFCERWSGVIPDDFIEITCDQYNRII